MWCDMQVSTSPPPILQSIWIFLDLLPALITAQLDNHGIIYIALTALDTTVKIATLELSHERSKVGTKKVNQLYLVYRAGCYINPAI